jgi:hypothetical protein
MAETLIYEPVRLGEKIVTSVISFAAVYLVLWIISICAADYRFEFGLTLAHAWTYYFRPIISLLQWKLPLIETAVGVVIAVPSAMFAIFISRRSGNPRPPEKNVRGRKVIMPFKSAASAAEKSAIEDFREGESVKYHLHPQYPLSRERLTRGICYAGSQGSGKTQAMLPLMTESIESALQPNARTIVFIHDFKGDFTEYFASIPGVSILAPWDSRSLSWDIAPDILSKSDAREFAANLTGADIATGQDVSWASGSAQILAGLIINLIQRNPRWKWSDLVHELDLDYSALRERAISGEPSASQLLNEGPVAKNPTMSFMTRLSSMVKPAIEAFANAETTATKSISFRRWFLMQPNLPRVLICQNSTRFEQMARSILKSATKSFASALDSIPDNSIDERFLFFDELPQCGKLPSFPQFFAVGRSKGCMPVYSFQIINQMSDRSSFGPDITKSLSGMTGTTVICRVQAETQKWASEMIGERSGERLTRSDSRQGLNSNTTSSTTISYQQFREPVLTPEQFSHEIGVLKKSGKFLGVAAFLLDNSNEVFRLAWPPSSPKKTAPANLPAPWTTEFLQQRQTSQDHPPALDQPGGPQIQPEGPADHPHTTDNTEAMPARIDPSEGAVPPFQMSSPGTAPAGLDALDDLYESQPTTPAQDTDEAEDTAGPSEAIGEHMASTAADSILPGLGLLIELASTLGDTTNQSAAGTPTPSQLQTTQSPPPASTAGVNLEDDDEEDLKD